MQILDIACHGLGVYYNAKLPAKVFAKDLNNIQTYTTFTSVNNTVGIATFLLWSVFENYAIGVC